jgi:ribosomal protein L35
MPKLKTKKSVVKKVKVTGNKKLTRRHTKQNHYNSRQNGNFKRKKRGDMNFFATDEKNIIKALPNL